MVHSIVVWCHMVVELALEEQILPLLLVVVLMLLGLMQRAVVAGLGLVCWFTLRAQLGGPAFSGPAAFATFAGRAPRTLHE